MCEGMCLLHHSLTPGRGTRGILLAPSLEDEVDLQHSSWPKTHVGQKLCEAAELLVAVLVCPGQEGRGGLQQGVDLSH